MYHVHDAGTPFVDLGVRWLDAVDSSSTILGSGVVEIMELGIYSLVCEHTDEAGNPATPLNRTVEVLDRTPAIIG